MSLKIIKIHSFNGGNDRPCKDLTHFQAFTWPTLPTNPYNGIERSRKLCNTFKHPMEFRSHLNTSI